jgi:endonuclease YncB( thermonuclease family)
VEVLDGDTVKVRVADRDITVRLEGVDCPERGYPFSRKATEFTVNMVLRKEVDLRIKERDRYGRTVARVEVEGMDVSLELVRAGLAWHYKRYSSDPWLAEAEEVARSEERGIWSQPKPIPPWETKHSR